MILSCGDGANLPIPIISTGNKLIVNFKSDRSDNHFGGFRVFWTEVTGSSSPTFSTSSNPTSPFTSPNYPSLYPAFANEWTSITVAPGSRIELTFEDFFLQPEFDSICDDYVKGIFLFFLKININS